MESDERLTALKKAYAEIILNTAQEAAARIMVSERKALRFQRELDLAKEDALQTLLRLKRMMDSKIIEAERTSLNKQKKIEELEAQLHEAEDIVKDLREELEVVQSELERVMNKKAHHLEKSDTTLQEETLNESRLNNSHSSVFPVGSHCGSITACDMKNLTSIQRNEGHRCCKDNDAHVQMSYISNHELPSIIMRSKEPELYRNGCTQRIRAFDKNSMDEGMSLFEQINVKDEESARKDEGCQMIRMKPVHDAKIMCNTENKVVNVDSNHYHDQAIESLPKTRRRATRCKRNTNPPHRYSPDQVVKRDQVSVTSSFRLCPVSLDNNARTVEDPSLTATETDTQSECADVSECETEFVKAGSPRRKMTEEQEVVLKREENGFKENYGDEVCRRDSDKVEVPMYTLEPVPSNSIDQVRNQPLNDRVIKYTFQRKRKRELNSNFENNASLEKCTSMRETKETQNGSVEPQNTCSITESSRENRRVAQVARQLISLSGKKWWQ